VTDTADRTVARSVIANFLLAIIDQRIEDLEQDERELAYLRRLLGEAEAFASAQPDPIDVYKADRERGRGYHDTQAYVGSTWSPLAGAIEDLS
jgi:hypothetical protein